jgi:deoxyhypusine synthase
MTKSKYLSSPTRPLRVEKRTISDLLMAMKDTAFQGRSLGEAAEIWTKMLEEEKLVVLMGLSGAMVPAGMGKIISHLIKNGYVDCLVSTGANIFHDLYEALGGSHFKGSPLVEDAELYQSGIDRMHDVFAPEEGFRKIDRFIADAAEKLDQEREYSSREIINFLGEQAAKAGGNEDSIVVAAYRENVPVFAPAIGDSSVGIALVLARQAGRRVVVDQLRDVEELTGIVEVAEKTGVIYIGGGVPKNFIQQTEVVLSLRGSDPKGHSYGIQFTTDTPHFGGLSGCTFEEGISWGKISPSAKKVQVFVDATVALPIVAHALAERAEGKERHIPRFAWHEGKANIKYKRKILK